MLRRLLGIALAACMSHLVVAGSDLVCATHGGHAVTEGAPASMPDMHHHGETGQAEKEQCKVPVSSTCCEAMTSCAASAALIASVDDHSPPYTSGRVIAFLADAPLTRILPPEPPPPKA